MEKLKEEETNSKWQLVKEICNISSRAADCAHRHHRGRRRPFIDWYLVLQVEKNVTLNDIKKQYHKMALRLHPDKNKHPQAEVAFNLLHQAYTCLFKESTRQEFDLERQKYDCVECKQRMLIRDNLPSTRFGTRSSKEACCVNYNYLRAKLSEEVMVIENCLFKRSSTLTKKELPVFNPSDYLSRGYPHCRRAKSTLFRFQTDKTCTRQFELPLFRFE